MRPLRAALGHNHPPADDRIFAEIRHGSEGLGIRD
jgi:hypothetical protein